MNKRYNLCVAIQKNILSPSIVFDCERMKYQDTGLYHYCLNLGNHLRSATAAGSERIHFYTPYGIHPLFGTGCDYLTQTEIHKLCMPDLRQYRIWHATHQDTDYMPSSDKRIRVVLNIHDLNVLYDPSKSEAKKQKYLRKVQRLINRADAIVCISEYSRHEVCYYCDTANKPVYVIYNGTNTLQAPELNTRSYKPLKPFLFSVGTVLRKKNFHALLPLLRDNSIELVVAGRIDDKEYYNHILYCARQMGIAENIRLVGPISEHEKAWYFNNCYAFVFPSVSEGFGLPVAEAMSVGKPLFLSNRTALPEIGSNVAFYFNDFTESAMQETFDNGMKQYKRLNMQENIIEQGKTFCWKKAAGEYLNVYRSLL